MQLQSTVKQLQSQITAAY